MRERARRRRPDEPAPERPAAADPPAVASILALQRSAGNRALVQRLVYNATSGNLVVPTEYAEQPVAWETDHVPKTKTPENTKPLKDHFVKNDQFKAAMLKHLGLDFVGVIAPSPEGVIKNNAPGLVSGAMNRSDVTGDKAVYAKMVHDVGEAAASHNHVVTRASSETRFKDLAEITAATRLVMRPDDFLPEAPDLPGKGVDLLKTVIPGTEKEPKKYFTYACVLIALVKDGGLAKAEEITKRDSLAGDVSVAVQALHNHYMSLNEPVQYDDGSVRTDLMKNWGYRMLWAGRSRWNDLAGKVNLEPGSYIFDIVGHTVRVEVLQTVAAHTVIDDAARFFRPDSDGRNFTKGNEYNELVTAIYKK